MKNCTKCGAEKPLLDFYSHPKTLDGKQSSCKVCCRKHQIPYTKQNRISNPESYKRPEYRKQYWKQYGPDYRANNPEYYNNMKFRNQKRAKYRYKTEPMFKLDKNIRTLIYMSFKRACNGLHNKSNRTTEILGCTVPEFISHLQSQFQPGMTLENHGAGPGNWNMDHIIPVSSATCEDDIIKFNHYSNIQPLWYEDNMDKYDKLDWTPKWLE